MTSKTTEAASGAKKYAAFSVMALIVSAVYVKLGQNFPLEWDDEVHFLAITDSILRGHFPFAREIGADHGIYWMPFNSNLVQAGLLRLFGFNSVYDLIVIRPWIVVPCLILSLACFAVIAERVTKSASLALGSTAILFLLPQVMGSLNTARPEGIVFLLALLSLLAATSRRYAVSLAVAAIAVLTHPLEGLFVFAAGLVCWVFDRLLRSRNETPAVSASKGDALWKILVILALLASFGVHVMALAHPAAITLAREQLSFQWHRKSQHGHVAGLIETGAFFLVAALAMSARNGGVRLKRTAFVEIWSKDWIAATVAIYATGLLSIATLGGEMWYSFYFEVATLLLTLLCVVPKLHRTHYLSRSALLLCALAWAFIGFKSLRGFEGMSPFRGTGIANRVLVESGLIGKIPDGATVLTDSFSMRSLNAVAYRERRKIEFVTSTPITPYKGSYTLKVVVQSVIGGARSPDDGFKSGFSAGATLIYSSKRGNCDGYLYEVKR